MKKLITILSIFLLINVGLKSYSQVVPTENLTALIEQEQRKELIEKDYKDIDVKVLNIPFEKITLPDGNISIKINSNSSELVSREYKKIDIYINSKYQRSIGVPIEIKIYKDILIARDTIMRDGCINAKNVTTKKCDILTLIQNPLEEKDLASDLISVRMYRAGDILDKRFAKIKPDIVKNATVTVLFKADNDMNITVDAIALTDGKIGNFIAVQNKTYKKIYTGKVIGTNKVLVEI